MSKDTYKKRMSPTDKGIVAIMAIIIVVVIALGVWAVAPKLKEAAQNNTQSNQTQTQQDTSIKGMAAEKGMSTEEFKTEYGIPADTSDDTDINELFMSLTIDNAAKLLDTTTEEYLEQNKLTGVVTGDQTVQEARDAFNKLTVAQVYGDDQETLSTLKENYGLTDDQVPETMTMEEFSALMEQAAQQKAAEQAEASEASANGDEQPEDTTASGEADVNSAE